MLPWLSFISVILLALALTGPHELIPKLSKRRDDHTIARVAAQTKQFITQYNRTPYSAAELRGFIRSRGQRSLALYDSMGHPLNYQRFSQFNYLLRSLGKNETEDNLSVRDDSIFAKLPSPAPVSVRYSSGNRASSSAMPFYPHLNLLGSPKGALIGWIAVDRERQQKKLVIRSRENSKLVMIAPHRRVDEFLWLKGSDLIVYTSSDRSDAGLHLWNTRTGAISSLTPKAFVSQDSGADDFRRQFIALKSFDPNTRILRYYRLATSSDAIDPARFFSVSHEQLITFSADFRRHEAIVQLAARSAGYLPKPRLAQPLNRGIELSGGNIRPEALAWQQVKTVGTVSDVLESWQRYSIGHTASPLYPYSLWGLSTIYGQAYQLYAANENPGAEQLQRFGMQIALALSNMQIAPAYLRAFATFNFNRLSQSLEPTLPLATISSDSPD